MTQYSKTRYKVVGVGGTFDHFHDGHAFFLTYAAELGFSLLIGITSDSMLHTKHYASTIEPYAVRVRNVKEFCQKNNIRSQVIRLHDPYGPTLERESIIKALCVTQETASGAEKINSIRQASQMRPLPVFVARMVLDENGKELHADRIRAGLINRTGSVYQNLLLKDLVLSAEQKELVSAPLGELLPKPDTKKFTSSKQMNQLPVCVVGDASLSFFVKNSLPYSLGIFDGQSNRNPITDSELEKLAVEFTATNPAGTISVELSQSIQKSLDLLNKSTAKSRQPQHIKVVGEEDLATAALILLLPLGCTVYYGQPDKGLVKVTVGEKIKEHIRQMILMN